LASENFGVRQAEDVSKGARCWLTRANRIATVRTQAFMSKKAGRA